MDNHEFMSSRAISRAFSRSLASILRIKERSEMASERNGVRAESIDQRWGSAVPRAADSLLPIIYNRNRGWHQTRVTPIIHNSLFVMIDMSIWLRIFWPRIYPPSSFIRRLDTSHCSSRATAFPPGYQVLTQWFCRYLSFLMNWLKLFYAFYAMRNTSHTGFYYINEICEFLWFHIKTKFLYNIFLIYISVLNLRSIFLRLC